jgi:hypothetical protein
LRIGEHGHLAGGPARVPDGGPLTRFRFDSHLKPV